MREAERGAKQIRLAFAVGSSDGPSDDFLFVAPGHNHIDSVVLAETGEQFEFVEDPARRIYRLKREAIQPREGANVDVRSFGDPPVLMEPRAFRPTLTALTTATDAAIARSDENYNRVLTSRCASLKQRSKAYLFFARYDAWSQAGLWRWLVDYGERLDPAPRACFEPYSNKVVSSAGAARRVEDALRFGHEWLRGAPLNRACAKKRGEPQRIDPPVDNRGTFMSAAAKRELAKRVRVLAAHHVGILGATFALESGEWIDMEKAMLGFSAGAMRVKPPLSDGSLLNFEPEGAQFFVFAEFFVQAWQGEADPARAEWWRRLATLFAFAQRPFCRAYGGDGKSLREDAYRRDRWNDIHPDVDAMHAQLVAYRKLHLTPLALLESMATAAFGAFQEDVDDQTQPER